MSLAAAIESALSRPGLVPGPSGLVALSLPVELDVETAFASASRAGGALFFWDARMAMQGMHFMNEVPWKTLYLHGLVRAADGQKMSKSTAEA